MNINELRKKLSAIVALMTEFTDKYPEPTEEQEKEFAKLEEEFSNIEKQIKRKEQIEAKIKYLDGTDEVPLGAGTNKQNAKNSEYSNAFIGYIRNGDSREFRNTLSTLTGEDGGYLVPEEWAENIIKGLAEQTHVRKYADVIATKGVYNMPIAGTKPTFGWVDELGTYPTHDVKFGNKVLEAHKAGGIILVSEELLEDEAFNLEQHLQELVTESLSLTEGTAFLVGDGVKKPLGMLQSIPDVNKIETAATDAISLDDVESLFLAPKSAYRKKGIWIISEKFFKAVFKLKDADGNRVWSQGLTANEEGRIFNKPYEIDDTLTAEAGEPLAFFGDISKYKIGDRGGIGLKRINQYEDKGMVGFKTYTRVDGKLTIDEAVAVLINKA